MTDADKVEAIAAVVAQWQGQGAETLVERVHLVLDGRDWRDESKRLELTFADW